MNLGCGSKKRNWLVHLEIVVQRFELLACSETAAISSSSCHRYNIQDDDVLPF